MKYSICLFTGSLRLKPKKPLEVVQPVGAAGRCRVADEQDRERGGQRLGQDREVRALDPAVEDREAEQAGDEHRAARTIASSVTTPAAERLPPARAAAVAVERAMKSGIPPGPASASLRCMAIGRRRGRRTRPGPRSSMPPRPQASPMPTATIAKQQVLAEQVEPEGRQQQRARRRTAARRRSRSRRAPPTGCDRSGTASTAAVRRPRPVSLRSCEAPRPDGEQALRPDLQERHDQRRTRSPARSRRWSWYSTHG